ncbi:MAG: molecular chaperone TorD family protein [bacterium]|nr:molecular chaperone TorD family protein [bacterium]
MPVPARTDREEMTALAPARRVAYSFLSAAFAEPPTQEGLAAVLGEAFLGSASALFSEQTLAPLRQYTQDAERASESPPQTRQEFMNLFKVPGGQYVTPYESVFRDTRDVAGRQVKGLLMGRSAIDVQKWYRLAALEIRDDYQDLPDHICIELDYLAHLCAKEQEFAAAGDEAKLTRAWEMQRDFLAAHVVSWIDELRDKIHEKSSHGYYRAVSNMAVDFTQRDLATLEGLLGPSNHNSAPAYEEASP